MDNKTVASNSLVAGLSVAGHEYLRHNQPADKDQGCWLGKPVQEMAESKLSGLDNDSIEGSDSTERTYDLKISRPDGDDIGRRDVGPVSTNSGNTVTSQKKLLSDSSNAVPAHWEQAKTESSTISENRASSENRARDVIEFKNRLVKKMQPEIGSSLIASMSEFSDDDYLTILKLAGHQDNNKRYFEKLKSFELPDDYHTTGHKEDLGKYRSITRGDWFIKDILLSEAIGDSRLNNEFGLYFSPSSAWLDPVAEKLRSLGCKSGIEVMGGKGYLSYFLSLRGFEMKVSDNQSQYQHSKAVSAPIHVRNECSLKTVKRFGETADFLVISWPPNSPGNMISDLFTEPDDYQILRAWGESKPVLFLGEVPDPAIGNLSTGSELFHHHLRQYFTAFKIPEYQGRHVGSVDEAIIFTPNGKKLITVGEASNSTGFVDQCRQM